ncbi:FG-GAP-like repeat-containing protein [Singulisphaera acidiphila]|uniref:RHS repeat-associated core domain protein n=2 Tax=Singulisphaera acidiphila TaxID=466153 RepID=L0DIM5_SINAD|nr:FG-GAP-like repeat-containing protein [Singulisphaera acidiphila]AGA28668.1 RHS repeat-associated core domain protein [Singulisphaera acidiphila DSM 18658]
MSRRQRKPLTPRFESLEPRQMLSHTGWKSGVIPISAAQAHLHLRDDGSARPDLDAFAQQLVSNRQVATRQGLGGLAKALKQHSAYAARNGWGACLAMVLQQHPTYAARHHLTALLTPPATSPASRPGPAVITPTVSTPLATTPIAKNNPSVQTPSVKSPDSTSISPVINPPTVTATVQNVNVGSTLDLTIQPGGLFGQNVTYTITPQPLPDHMTFNRQTGELIFSPAPGQGGVSTYTVAASDGVHKAAVRIPIQANEAQLETTELSGHVVDETGAPRAGIPVAIGDAKSTTDAKGNFTLTGVPTTPGPIKVGDSKSKTDDWLNLTAPVEQLLGHQPYANANNAIIQPLILPKIDWTSTASFRRANSSNAMDVTNPAMPGFDIRVTPGDQAQASGELQLANLSANLSAQHMPPGVSSGMLLYKSVGIDLTKPVQLTMPNTQGYAPGLVVSLLGMNMKTGGHDVIGRMVVSADGATMTSLAPVRLASAPSGAIPNTLNSLAERLDFGSGGGDDSGGSGGSGGGGGGGGGGVPGDGSRFTFTGCLLTTTLVIIIEITSPCDGCETTGNEAAPGVDIPNGGGMPDLGRPQLAMASDAGLVTGDFFQDHQSVLYQSQGYSRGIDLQYSSGQAHPYPVVQAQFTTQTAANSASISSITAQITLGGVLQGSPVTYYTPGGLADNTTYTLPLQVDASALPTGVYHYSMVITENFGSSSPSSITSTIKGDVNIVNAVSSPYGAGWSVGGLQQLSQLTTGGSVLITAGQQGTERFDTLYNNGQSYLQDLALATSTSDSQILANDGRAHFTSTSSITTSNVVGTVAGTFNGDGKPDQAVLNSSELAILINNGLGGFSAGATYSLPSGTTGKALAVGNFSGHTNGVLDLAVLLVPSYVAGNYSVAVYVGNGDGTFASPVVTSAGNGVSSGTTPNTMVAVDVNNDGLDDLAFTTDNGLVDVMLATGSGSLGSASTLPLPSTDTAVALVAVDYNHDGKQDLVVEIKDSDITEYGNPFIGLDVFTGDGTGGYTFTAWTFADGHAAHGTIGIVAGKFNGDADGLEIAVPLGNQSLEAYVQVFPLTVSGTWGAGKMIKTNGSYFGSGGNIVAADFNGTGKPGIALTDGSGEVHLILPDPGSSGFLPTSSFTSTYGMLAAAPFAQHAASLTYAGPLSDPSTLIHNSNGTWTRTYPNGTVFQFDSAGRETSMTDRNGNATTFGYVTSGAAAGALQTMTDPVGLVTTLTYDTYGHLQKITDPAARVTTITVDSNANLTQIVDPDGATSQYGYSTPSNHLVTTEVSPNGHTATAHYDSFGLLSSETLFDGTSTTSVTPAKSRGLTAYGGIGTLATGFKGSVTDPNGRTTTIGFSWMSHPTGTSDATGASTSTKYSNRGFPVARTDALNRTTTYTYDVDGNVTSITLPGNVHNYFTGEDSEIETITYGVNSVPTSITDFNGNTTTFTLDSHGNVLRRTDPDSLHEDWTYNSAGQVLTDTDRKGHTTTFAYDSRGQLTTITYPGTGTGTGTPHVVYGYDSAGDITSVTDELSHTTTMTYDLAGRVLSMQNPIQAGAGKATSYTYDADGNLLTVTDALGHVTSFAYNARDEQTGMTDAVNQGTSHHTTYTYDASGNLKTMTDPLGHTTTFGYDNANRLTSATDPNGNTTTYYYDLTGALVAAATPGDAYNGTRSTSYFRDVDGRVQVLHLPTIMDEYTNIYISDYTFGYDANGNRTTVLDPNGHTTTNAYDSLNRLTSVKDPLSHVTTYGYDANGNQATVTDPLGHVTSFAYDDRNRLVSQTAPTGGGTTTYSYDLAGRLTSLTDPVGNATTYTYDAANRMATETSPTGGVTTYTYDLVGNLTQKVDPLGRIIQYTYDADNRETTEKWLPIGGGSAFYTMTITYDSAGRATSIADNNSHYAYTYDNAGRLITVDDQGTTGLPQVTLTYGYDYDGDRTSMTDSLGGVVSYSYDQMGRLYRETQSGGPGISPERVDFGYDLNSNLTSLTRYSDLAGTSTVLVSAYTYDAANRLTDLVHETSLYGGTVVSKYGYTLDAVNRLTQEVKIWTTTGGTTSDTLNYSYTNDGQLKGITHSNGSFSGESFGYDSNGNRNTTGYTTGTGNQITSDGTFNYAYDVEGNLTSKTEVSSGDETLYKWDYRNRLIEVDQLVGGSIAVLATYTYDAADRRIGVTEGGATRWTLFDVNSPVLDFDSLGTQTARYLHGPTNGTAVDQVLARDTAGGVAWYLSDRLGSIGDIIDNSAGLIDHVDYSAYGQVLNETWPTAGDRFKYAGMEFDMSTGLNLAKYRVEDPFTGRWISQDPLGFYAGDSNTYRYSSNNSINFSDPSGLAPKLLDDYTKDPVDPIRPYPNPYKPRHPKEPSPGDAFLDQNVLDKLCQEMEKTKKKRVEHGGTIVWSPTNGFDFTDNGVTKREHNHIMIHDPKRLQDGTKLQGSDYIIIAYVHIHVASDTVSPADQNFRKTRLNRAPFYMISPNGTIKDVKDKSRIGSISCDNAN